MISDAGTNAREGSGTLAVSARFLWRGAARRFCALRRKETGMPSAQLSVQPPFDELRCLADRLSALALRLRERCMGAAAKDRRIGATGALLAVMVGVALVFAPALLRPITDAKPHRDASANSLERAAASVKFVGASPRSDDCAQQVWPYIEPRCLAGPAAGGKSHGARSNAAPAPEPPAARPDDTTPSGAAPPGAAPRDPVASASSDAREEAGRARVATTHLSPSRRRIDALAPAGLP